MPYAPSGLLGSLASVEFGSIHSTGLVQSTTTRLFHLGSSLRTFLKSTQRRATKAMSALAASCVVPALIVGPSARTNAARDSGPRLFEMTAGIPALANASATL